MTDTVTDARPSHQTIEEAFKPAREMIDRLPDESFQARRAKANLDAAEEYAHDFRDTMRPPIGE